MASWGSRKKSIIRDGVNQFNIPSYRDINSYNSKADPGHKEELNIFDWINKCGFFFYYYGNDDNRTIEFTLIVKGLKLV